jgi:hypothetical protein
MDVGQLVEAMEAYLRFRSQTRGEIVVGETTDSVQPLVAVIRIEIRKGATNVERLIAAFASCYNLGSSYRREKEESGE